MNTPTPKEGSPTVEALKTIIALDDKTHGMRAASEALSAAAQLARAALAKADAPASPAPAGDESYLIGKRDGYEEAVQEIDVLTGGDGEYVAVSGPDPDGRACPGPDAMKARIAARFAALAPARKALEKISDGKEVYSGSPFATEMIDWEPGEAAAIAAKALEGIYAALASEDGWRPTHRHVKTGKLYRLITSAVLEVDPYGFAFAVYEDAPGPEQNVWLRRLSEFSDGRFEPLPSPPKTEAG